MEASMTAVWEELGIPRQHIQSALGCADRYIVVAAKSWLKCLEENRKLCDFPVYSGLDHRVASNLGHAWTKICIQTYKKHNYKVIPLPRSRWEAYCEIPLTFAQVLTYVSTNNFRHIWGAASKNYSASNSRQKNRQTGSQRRSETTFDLIPYDVVLKELIQRIFGCCVIHAKLDRIKSPVCDPQYAFHQIDMHANLFRALIAVETNNYFSIIFYPPTIDTSLSDCITYSPAILSRSHNKPLFIIYQILKAMKHLHDNGLMMGDLKLRDIYLGENLWLQIIPNLETNLIRLDGDDTPTDDATGAGGGDEFTESAKFDLKFAYDLQQFSLREYCEMWCNGQLSNFDYLTILNNVAGRRMDCPEHHHIMPWVTDFTNRNGMNWRDLSKSKYRINKGDPHLDFMFTSTDSNEIAHHVSDFLSEITYFVYMARRTPQNVLTQHVRPIWVPGEYPATMQRLQEWTPDECIPEFFSDPMVFKSIHEDLPDLELPVWATCPEDFIAKHREALESQHVSERLHHWIDLNFGYKLSGHAAVKSKNVCLPLVDNHKNLCKRGIVQLLTHPHPPKRPQSVWFASSPPRIAATDQRHRLTRSSEDLSLRASTTLTETDYHSPVRKYNTSPKAGHKRNSNQNIPEDKIATNMERSTSYHTNVQRSPNTIVLPKDYNPCAQLNFLENMETFFAKTFLNQKPQSCTDEKLAANDLMFDESLDNSFTNRIFSEAYEANLIKDEKRLPNSKQKNLIIQNTTRNFKQIIAEKRKRESQVIGCLIVELFLQTRLRPVSMSAAQSFEDRFLACQSVARAFFRELPKCVQHAVKLFLLLDNAARSIEITDLDFPRPSAHQILEPIFSNSIIPFPVNYYRIHALITCLDNFDFTAQLLALNTYFHCDGLKCSQFHDLDRKRVIFSRKIAECKVKACCLHIEGLLEPVGYEQFNSVELLLRRVIDLLTSEDTSILTAWYLFDPIATALGIKQTQKHFLEPMLRLFNSDSDERTQFQNRSLDASMRFVVSSSFKSRKSVKLYHHSFLLRLIVRFGLKCFLDNFVSALIEAVGGYREPEESNGFHYHGNSFPERRVSRSTKNFRICCNEESDNSLTLISPDHSDLKSDNTVDNTTRQEIEELFTFEADESAEKTEFEVTSIESLELRLNHSTAEEAIEECSAFTPDKLRDLIYGSKLSNNSFEEDKISVTSQTDSPRKSDPNPDTVDPKSPTIPIPNAFRRNYEFNTIDCEIGSKRSVDSFDFLRQCENMTESQENITRIDETSMQTSASNRAASEARHLRSNRISEMSMESLIWLSHRLGPVLTARYLTRNLLKMLTVCYIGQENLLPANIAPGESKDDKNLDLFTMADSNVVGDYNAARVLECLIAAAGLFGEQFILLQYLPHISELIAMCKKRITASLEGALISSLQLIKCLIPCLLDTTIMDQLHDAFLSNILHPIIRILGSSKFIMPSGYLGRNVLARKLIDAIYVLTVRIGPEMSKEHLCVPALQRFFLIFDKAYGLSENLNKKLGTIQSHASATSLDDSNFVEIRRDGKLREWNIRGSQILQVKSSNEGASPSEGITPPNVSENTMEKIEVQQRERGMEEIRDVFTPNLAHCSYLGFLQFLGDAIMSKTVINQNLILTLCHEFEQPDYASLDKVKRHASMPSTNDEIDVGISNSFGSSVIGNRIEVPNSSNRSEVGPMEVLDMVAYKMEQVNTTRHLRGNWLAYWEHEIGRSDKDLHLNLKQIKLQTFAGHTNTVRSILALDNENSFMSASKDKTVKLWSLRSEGDGTKITSSQFTYANHKKSVHSLAFLDSLRYVVSCDSGVHIWDPFIGRAIGILDSHTKYSPVSVVRTYPSPSPLILAGTAESTVKVIDARTVSYVNEWKVTTTPSTTVRCLACAPSGDWIAVGLSSGSIIILDGRTGMIQNTWRATDGELLQLVALNDYQIVSSSLDHSISVWSVTESHLLFHLKQPPEPAHCLQSNGNELIFATPANRIGVYGNLLSPAGGSYSITKLRSETLRGVLTSLAVLPLHRMILAGNDSGNIVLLC